MIVAARGSAINPGSSLFDAIVQKHQQLADEYLVVTQPDHARLSGAFAAAIDRNRLPYVTDEIVAAIETHDIGWLQIDGAAPNPVLPPYDSNGRLRSFITTPPTIFVEAWTASIAHAERIGPAAGLMVSQHFESLAKFRLQRTQDTLDDTARLHHFLAQESARQNRLRRSADESTSAQLLNLLQFCDVISLYVCCGLESAQEFSQDFGVGKVTIAGAKDAIRLTGIPLRGPVKAQCPAFRWRPGSPALLPDPIAVSAVPA